jgi:hypothetical protein
MRLVTTGALVGLSGCSFIGGISGAYRMPDKPLPGDPHCSHYLTASSDIVLAVPLLIVATGAALLMTPCQSGESTLCTTSKPGWGVGAVVIGAGSAGALAIGSAIYGLHASNRCEEAVRKMGEPPVPPEPDLTPGIIEVQHVLESCGNRYNVVKNVVVELTVNPDGRIVSAPMDIDHAQFEACANAGFATLVFPRSRSPHTFSTQFTLTSRATSPAQ